MSMMYVMHHAFRRDLADFLDAVARTPMSRRTTWSLLEQRWLQFAHELHTHHGKEDDHLWPLLRERAGLVGDGEALTLLAEMEAEHALVDPLLTAAATGFRALAEGPDPAARDRLVDHVAALQRSLGEHLAHEERDAMAIMQRYVGGEEWTVMEREQFRGKPSLKQAAFMLPWMFKGLPDAVAERIKAEAGLPFVMILALTRRRFAAREALAFGVRAEEG